MGATRTELATAESAFAESTYQKNGKAPQKFQISEKTKMREKPSAHFFSADLIDDLVDIVARLLQFSIIAVVVRVYFYERRAVEARVFEPSQALLEVERPLAGKTYFAPLVHVGKVHVRNAPLHILDIHLIRIAGKPRLLDVENP